MAAIGLENKSFDPPPFDSQTARLELPPIQPFRPLYMEKASLIFLPQSPHCSGSSAPAMITSSGDDQIHQEDQTPLPGFRFHPTDEELVGFFLRRKVEKMPISLELIRQIDIYKHDPWDLPSLSGSIGDQKELYFYCKRGRKYKNSIRPNRVTSSGFWKATGIDKPVYSHGGEGHDCIGLKKTLVYYRGSAGKGTKTEWMMHEFRLPTNFKNSPQEAEIWTLCRIFKRNISMRKYSTNLIEIQSRNPLIGKSYRHDNGESFINFSSQVVTHNENIPAFNHINNWIEKSGIGQLTCVAQSPSSAPHPSFSPMRMDRHDYHWDELRSVVESALVPSIL